MTALGTFRTVKLFKFPAKFPSTEALSNSSTGWQPTCPRFHGVVSN